MKYFTADIIFRNIGSPLTNHVIITENDGRIVDVVHSDEVSADVLKIQGAIVPGFVNAHCHLELSHLKNQLNTGTGLIPFIKSVVTLRDFPQEEIDQAIADADKEMYENGIVAVGDISNKVDTAMTKSASPIKYYTFVEMFDFLQDQNAQSCFDQYFDVFKNQSDLNGNLKSCVPHAPYSVSPTLFQLINEANDHTKVVSIHNQETVHENLLFQEKNGELLGFFNDFGIDISNFKPSNKPSIDYAINHMDESLNTLMVHNTMCDSRDIKVAHDWNRNTYWVTCPNANLFIENSLPNYKTFIEEKCKMGIGTDSLSSNWQLSIFDEMQTIQKYQSFIETKEIIKWSSFWSSEALGFHELGSIQNGKKPGLIALEGIQSSQSPLSSVSSFYRII